MLCHRRSRHFFAGCLILFLRLPLHGANYIPTILLVFDRITDTIQYDTSESRDSTCTVHRSLCFASREDLALKPPRGSVPGREV